MNITKASEHVPKRRFSFKLPGNIPLSIMPILLFYIVIFGYPVAYLLWLSIYSDGVTLSAYIRFFTEPVYIKMMLYTIKVGLVVAFWSLIIAYPVAYFLSSIKKRWAIPILGIILVPFWSSVMVRMYAWMVILGSNGILNNLLKDLSILTESLPFLGTNFAVYMGLIYYLLPYMVLTLYGVMSNIDRNLMLAAENLGASPIKAFFKVFVPLTKSGMIAGGFIVFILGIGMYITPSLLGGADQTTLPLLVATLVEQAIDWQFAAVLSVILLVIMGVVMWIASKFSDLSNMWGVGMK